MVFVMCLRGAADALCGYVLMMRVYPLSGCAHVLADAGHAESVCKDAAPTGYVPQKYVAYADSPPFPPKLNFLVPGIRTRVWAFEQRFPGRPQP